MLFVIDKLEFQRAISFARDDRKRADWGLAGPFMRLEAKHDYVKLDGVEASAKIPATVYEPGVLFLKVTVLRRLLTTIKTEKYLTIQVMADGLLMDLTFRYSGGPIFDFSVSPLKGLEGDLPGRALIC